MRTTALAALVVLSLAPACGDDASSDAAAPAAAPGHTTVTSSEAINGDAAASCVESYGTGTLAGRAFAFDGTVVSFGEAAEGDDVDPYVEVAFDVHEWFVPDQVDGEPLPPTVSVLMLPPDARTSVENPTYGDGSRLLVSGEPRWGGDPLDTPIAWTCGFTRTYDDTTAAAWRDAFAG